MKRLESSVQRSIVTLLKSAGWVVDKPVSRSHNGFPDIAAYKDGKTIFIEVKRPGGKTTPIQDYWISKLKNMGFEAYVIESPKEIKKLGIIS